MKNIFLIPTQEESNLQLNKHNKLFTSFDTKKYKDCENQFVYITDNSEIEVGNTYYNYKTKTVQHRTQGTDNESYLGFLKVILTNNPNLKNVQQIAEEQLQEYVANPVNSVEVVKITLPSNNGKALFGYNYSVSFLVFPPKKELKKGITITHLSENRFCKGSIELGTACKKCSRCLERLLAKEIKTERLYTEEDLKKAFEDGGENIVYGDMYGYSSTQTFEKWLKTIK